MDYRVVLTQDENGAWLATVPAFAGCHTWGESRAQALENAKEAIEGCIESLLDTGDPIPDGDLPVEVEVVRVDRPAA
jgi:predicted RNase H-like HicB family nuclease